MFKQSMHYRWQAADIKRVNLDEKLHKTGFFDKVFLLRTDTAMRVAKKYELSN